MRELPPELLEHWLSTKIGSEALDWVRDVSRLRPGDSRRAWLLAFSSAPRRVGKADLALTTAERQAAHRARPGWHPGSWSVDQAVRTRLALALEGWPVEPFLDALGQLFDDADLGEQVALYQALPVLPHPSVLTARAAEGIRSNMKAVFDAVALRNPYPADYLDLGAFNQMVLKCLFVGSPLHRVWGLDDRVNRQLAGMLADYARERWAAGRSVSPELWRAVGPVADGSMLELLGRALAGSEKERLGVILACHGHPSGTELLGPEHAALVERVESGAVTWDNLLAPGN